MENGRASFGKVMARAQAMCGEHNLALVYDKGGWKEVKVTDNDRLQEVLEDAQDGRLRLCIVHQPSLWLVRTSVSGSSTCTVRLFQDKKREKLYFRFQGDLISWRLENVMPGYYRAKIQCSGLGSQDGVSQLLGFGVGTDRVDWDTQSVGPLVGSLTSNSFKIKEGSEKVVVVALKDFIMRVYVETISLEYVGLWPNH